MEDTNDFKAFNKTIVDVLNLENSQLETRSKEFQVCD